MSMHSTNLLLLFASGITPSPPQPAGEMLFENNTPMLFEDGMPMLFE